ncbi:hypothetical protein JR316_0006223 [Psilocybe cubensis]|uniref:Uncharacterized protein n=2 Tax=Psilocybe cubensis TaxID=181762 RepID=A0ACB8H1I9_PSICU|nr:hypothetical protein JR316_0006223 [Psilocybe cubensis]KAH9481696.1 hypothetical protein JR316_0006223 [Psilocybe cubensis]
MVLSLPFELIEAIIDAVADTDDHKTLSTCSLTCPLFVTLCQKHIFHTIRLEDTPIPHVLARRISRLEEISRTSPWIADYIQHVQCVSRTLTREDSSTRHWPSTESAALPTIALFGRLTKVHTVLIENIGVFTEEKWDFPDVQAALCRLIYLPTIEWLLLKFVDNFSPVNVIQCVNLKHLSLRMVSFRKSAVHTQDFSSPQTTHLDTLSLDHQSATALLQMMKDFTRSIGDTPIIDFRKIKTTTLLLDRFMFNELGFVELLQQLEWMETLRVYISPSMSNYYLPGPMLFLTFFFFPK